MASQEEMAWKQDDVPSETTHPRFTVVYPPKLVMAVEPECHQPAWEDELELSEGVAGEGCDGGGHHSLGKLEG